MHIVTIDTTASENQNPIQELEHHEMIEVIKCPRAELPAMLKAYDQAGCRIFSGVYALLL